MKSKKPTPQYSPEVRERAVRMVQEHRGEYPSLWAAVESIAPKIGCVPQTLHEWVKKHEIDTGLRDGVTTDERERLKALEREVKELCQREPNFPQSWESSFPHPVKNQDSVVSSARTRPAFSFSFSR